MLKYFSHRGLWTEYLPTDKPSIIVGPPHGVFPYGSLLACVAVPRTSGFFFWKKFDDKLSYVMNVFVQECI
jgi:hypothetical protein